MVRVSFLMATGFAHLDLAGSCKTGFSGLLLDEEEVDEEVVVVEKGSGPSKTKDPCDQRQG